MAIRNRKSIGLIALVAGLAIILFWGANLYKICSLPFTGISTDAEVIGYKISSNGARKVQKPSSTKSFASGRSPFFSFVTAGGDTVVTYSNAPQIFVLFNYDIGDHITVAYPSKAPHQAVIVNWREFPGLLLMIAFGLLMLIISKSYLSKSHQ